MLCESGTACIGMVNASDNAIEEHNVQADERGKQLELVVEKQENVGVCCATALRHGIR